MARLNRETALQALNRPWSWDEFTIDFAWHQETYGGVPFWSVVAHVTAPGGDDVRVAVCFGDTAPDMLPGVYAHGADFAELDRSDAFIDDYDEDGLIDFIRATANLINRETVPDDEMTPRRQPVDAARLW